MAWLEITVNTQPGSVEALAESLTGLGFEDFCIEDQQEFETFLRKTGNTGITSTRVWKSSFRASAG